MTLPPGTPARTPGPASATTTPSARNLVLRGWRETRGMTRNQMADALSDAAFTQGDVLICHPSLIAKWETGRIQWPSPRYHRALHALTGRTPASLGFTTPPPRRPPAAASAGAPAEHPAARCRAIRTTRPDTRARAQLLEQLTALRRQRGLTQAQVARRMNTAETFISQLETGATDPHLSALQHYARAVSTRLSLTLAPAPLHQGQDPR